MRILALAIAATALVAVPAPADQPVPHGCSIVTTGYPGLATSCSFIATGEPMRYVAAATGWDIQIDGEIVAKSGPETIDLLQFSVKTGTFLPHAGAHVRLAIHKADRPLPYQDGYVGAHVLGDATQPEDVYLLGLSDALYTPGDNRWMGQFQLEIHNGQTLRIHNRSASSHTLTADWGPSSTCPDCLPIFDSGAIGPGGSAAIDAVSTLPPRVYPFHCAVYPTMRGLLYVVAS